MDAIAYDFDAIIQYNTDSEYRREVLRIFQIQSTAFSAPVAADDESKENDPLPYEERELLDVNFDAIAHTIEQIVKYTKRDPLLHKIYTKAAARLMSTDVDTGAVLLFTYNGFDVFHRCLHVYLRHPEEWTEYHPIYAEMMDRLKKNEK